MYLKKRKSIKYKILIVGGTGFIGYHLVKKCVEKKWDVSSISTRPPKTQKRLKGVKYIVADISKIKKLKNALKNDKYKYVVNLGGHVNHKNKIKTYRSHFIGCKNLVSILRNNKPEMFLQMGSSLEYGISKSPIKETFNCKPISNYGKAKFLASSFLIKEHKQKKFPIVILRLFQAYGPMQENNRLIPYVINSCIKDKKFQCSDGTQLRDFIYIDDLISLIFKCLKNKNILGEIFNAGSGNPIKIKNLINKIYKIVKLGKPQFGAMRMRSDEIKNFYPNMKKTKKFFNWNVKTNINLGILKTIKFFQKKIDI